MNVEQALRSFCFEDIRQRFFVKVVGTSSMNTLVKIFDKTVSEIDPIYEYSRNYSFLKTFEVFRLWDDEKMIWRHFAIISPSYTNFKILDLDNREIIAENPYPKMTQKDADRYNKLVKNGELYEAGDDDGSFRFCPAEFHVPDVYDVLDSGDVESMKKAAEGGDPEDSDFWIEWLNTFLVRRSFGFESGCVWGDDWSYKLQTIDLTKILQGEVSDHDTFGYLIVPDGIQLSQIYNNNYYDDEAYSYLELNVPISFRMDKKNTQIVDKVELFSTIPGLVVENVERIEP